MYILPIYIALTLTEAGMLLFIYISDKDLKFVSEIGLKQIDMLTLKRGKYSFVYYKRKEGIITKHAFVCSIISYILNGVAYPIIFIPYITNMDLLLGLVIMMIFLLDFVLIIFVYSQPKLTFEEKEIRDKEKMRLLMETIKKEEAEVKARRQKRKLW